MDALGLDPCISVTKCPACFLWSKRSYRCWLGDCEIEAPKVVGASNTYGIDLARSYILAFLFNFLFNRHCHNHTFLVRLCRRQNCCLLVVEMAHIGYNVDNETTGFPLLAATECVSKAASKSNTLGQ